MAVSLDINQTAAFGILGADQATSLSTRATVGARALRRNGPDRQQGVERSVPMPHSGALVFRNDLGGGRSMLRRVGRLGMLLVGMFLVVMISAEENSAAGAAPERKPTNILFIFSDDHAYQAISAYQDSRKLLETPNLDRLAREGVLFKRCLVPNSICGPSRASVLTGKYSHLNGFYNNSNSKFDGSQMTFHKLLGKAGYQTAVIGKWHLVSDPVGFDEWHILPGQGAYYNPTMIHNGEKLKHVGYTTDIITDLSLDWLKKRDKSRPFLLMCQHKAPHREWMPALRHLGHDRDRVYPEPATLFDDYSGRGKAEHDQDMTIAKTMNDVDLKLSSPVVLTPDQRKLWDEYYEPRNKLFRAAELRGDNLTRWKYQRYMHDYLGTVKAVDESVGRLLKFLDDEGLAENTLVVYSADQGFYLGEHGWFDKRWIFEESLRTPLLIRWPGVAKPGMVNSDLVSNIDFAETFLDVAGLPIPGEMQGRSLTTVLKGETPSNWRKSFYYQYYEYPSPHKVRPHHGVVTARYKLVHFDEKDTDEWELFDLEKDPAELKSVYVEPAYASVVIDLKRELARLRAELKVPEVTAKEASGRSAK
jgi:arylsulfatase A-like enzyme